MDNYKRRRKVGEFKLFIFLLFSSLLLFVWEKEVVSDGYLSGQVVREVAQLNNRKINSRLTPLITETEKLTGRLGGDTGKKL